jgi:hypothetical protein
MASLLESIDALVNLKINPFIMSEAREAVLSDEFGRDVTEFDSHIFGSVKRSAEVEIRDVEGGKACMGRGEHIVELEFDQLKGAGVSASISQITDVVPTDGDVCAVRVILGWTHFTDNPGVGNIVASSDGLKGVGAIDAFASRAGVVGANALAEPTKFIGIGLVPYGLVGRMGAELMVFKHMPGGLVQDRECDVVGRAGGGDREVRGNKEGKLVWSG